MGILTVVRTNAVQLTGLDVPGTEFVSVQQQDAIAYQIRQITADLEILVEGRNKAELATHLEGFFGPCGFLIRCVYLCKFMCNFPIPSRIRMKPTEVRGMALSRDGSSKRSAPPL